MANGRNKNPRSKNDFYQTPGELVYSACNEVVSLLNTVHGNPDDISVLEPGCGSEAPFASFFAKNGYNAMGVDILDEWSEIVPSVGRPLCHYMTDYTDESVRWLGDKNNSTKLIIGNPPFSLAEEFVWRSLELLHPTGILCFVLRLGFWCSGKREKLMTERPPYWTRPLDPRPSFKSNGKTDGQEYALFMWPGIELEAILKANGVKPCVERLKWR